MMILSIFKNRARRKFNHRFSFMTGIHHGFILLVVSITLSSCEELNLPYFKTSIPPDPCDPATGLYDHGTHYINRDMLNSEGQVDPARLFEAVDPENSPCNPVHQEENQSRQSF